MGYFFTFIPAQSLTLSLSFILTLSSPSMSVRSSCLSLPVLRCVVLLSFKMDIFIAYLSVALLFQLEY